MSRKLFTRLRWNKLVTDMVSGKQFYVVIVKTLDRQSEILADLTGYTSLAMSHKYCKETRCFQLTATQISFYKARTRITVV